MQQSIILFSGQEKSTYLTASELEKLKVVHLLMAKNLQSKQAAHISRGSYINLCRIYDPQNIKYEVLDTQLYQKQFCQERYFKVLSNFKKMTAILNFVPISTHWMAAEYALQNRIPRIVDGLSLCGDRYLNSNKIIFYQCLKNFYKKLSIDYEAPLITTNENINKYLTDRGILFGSNQIIFQKDKLKQGHKFFLKSMLEFYFSIYSKEEYEMRLQELYAKRFKTILEKINGATRE